jgi:dTDP-glucose pyrophosphorylase
MDYRIGKLKDFIYLIKDLAYVDRWVSAIDQQNHTFTLSALETEKVDFYCGITTEEDEEKIKNNFSVEADENSKLIKCIEKPQVVTNNIKGTGFCIFNAETQKLIRETYKTNPHKIKDICECFNYLTELGYGGYTLFVAEKEFNINTASDLTEAEKFLK